jgi:DNA-binding response OmpR family regulator
VPAIGKKTCQRKEQHVHILIVDNEPDICEVIAATLNLHWHDCKVSTAHDGEEAIEQFYQQNPDLIILDICMPRLNGLEVLEHIRRISDVPVIILSVRGEEIDKVRGLEMGADDYVTKPFGHLELLARVHAVMRRTDMIAPTAKAPSFQLGDFAINYARREVSIAGRVVELTPTEYNLLYHLVRNAGRVMTHASLLTRVWGKEYAAEIDYLKVYIRRLREKLEPNPHNPWYILTERGIGYKFRAASPSSLPATRAAHERPIHVKD